MDCLEQHQHVEQQAPDWAELPRDCISLIIGQLFASARDDPPQLRRVGLQSLFHRLTATTIRLCAGCSSHARPRSNSKCGGHVLALPSFYASYCMLVQAWWSAAGVCRSWRECALPLVLGSAQACAVRA